MAPETKCKSEATSAAAGVFPGPSFFSIIYPYTNLRFPSQMANMVQTLHTCDALARSGRARVDFIVRNRSGWDSDRIRSYYGLDDNPAFDIHSIPLPHSENPVMGKIDNMAYRMMLIRAVNGIAGRSESSILYARDASLVALLTSMPGLKKSVKFAFEAHNVFRISLAHSHTWHANSKSINPWKIRAYAALERRAIRRSAVILAVTEKLKEMLVDEYGVEREKIFVVPDAARQIKYERQCDESDGNGALVGYIGQLFPSRGVDMLVRAMRLLESSVRLLVVGGKENGPDIDRLRRLARSLGVENRITFTGYVEPSRVGSWLSKPDVLVMPLVDDEVTRNFASSMKQFEYMTTRKPIVASDLPSTREILHHGKTAILVKPGSADSLAGGISLVLNDKALARRISEAAYREVNEKYTFGKRAEKILAALEKACR